MLTAQKQTSVRQHKHEHLIVRYLSQQLETKAEVKWQWIFDTLHSPVAWNI